MSVDVDVVIPSFGRADLVRACLDGLEGQEPSHDVTVVDTGPEGGLEAELADLPVRVVSFPENTGFAAAANRGIEAGRAPAVVLLNDDVVPERGFLRALVAPLSAERHVGMAAALLIEPGGHAVDSYGLEMDRSLAGFPRHAGVVPEEAAADPREPVGPTGGAAAYLREAIEGVDGFDESMTAYGEDRDLAIRLRMNRWSAAGAADARAVHLGSATYGRDPAARRRAIGRSRGYLLRKYGVMRHPARAAVVLVSDGASVLFQLARGETAGLRGRIEGWRAARRALPFPADQVDAGISLVDGMRRRRRLRG